MNNHVKNNLNRSATRSIPPLGYSDLRLGDAQTSSIFTKKQRLKVKLRYIESCLPSRPSVVWLLGRRESGAALTGRLLGAYLTARGRKNVFLDGSSGNLATVYDVERLVRSALEEFSVVTIYYPHEDDKRIIDSLVRSGVSVKPFILTKHANMSERTKMAFRRMNVSDVGTVLSEMNERWLNEWVFTGVLDSTDLTSLGVAQNDNRFSVDFFVEKEYVGVMDVKPGRSPVPEAIIQTSAITASDPRSCRLRVNSINLRYIPGADVFSILAPGERGVHGE